MPGKTKDAKPTKRRTEIKDLPREEKNLTKEEQKKVQGGARGVAAGIVILKGGGVANEQPEP